MIKVWINNMIDYIRLWLRFTTLSELQIKQVLEWCHTGNKLPNDLTEYSYLIEMWCEFTNFKLNEKKYKTLDALVNTNLENILRSESITIPNTHLTPFKKIVTLIIFKTICETNANITIHENEVIILIEFLTRSADLISQQWLLLSHLDNIYNPVLSVYKIKCVLVKLTRYLVTCKELNLKLQTMETTKILTYRDLIKDRALISEEPLFKKNITIEHKFNLSPNYKSWFKLQLSEPQLIKTKNQSFIVTRFPGMAFPTIKQHHNRQKTVTSDAFDDTLISLAKTPLLLSHNALNTQWEIALLEFNNTITNLTQIGANTIELVPILHELLGSVQKVTKKMMTTTFIADNVKTKLKEKVSDKTKREFKEELTHVSDINKLKNKWDRVIAGNAYLQKNAIRIQQKFSKVFQLYLLKQFKDFVLENDLDKWYLIPYADFRGRFYYNSIASPQSFWGFRHLYKCNNDTVDKDVYLLALGTLFKKEITNNLGEIALDQLTPLGRQKYEHFKSLSLNELFTTLKDTTLVAETAYYINAVKSTSETFFVWRDTTCSMAQHAVKLLGFKPESLKYLNLDNSTIAYDTYTIYILKLKQILVQRGWTLHQLNLLTRALLKQVIMTIGYGVTFYTAYKRHKIVASELVSSEDDYNWITDQGVFKQIFQLLATSECDNEFYILTKDNWTNKQNLLDYFQLPDLKFTPLYLKPSIKLKNLELPPVNNTRVHHQISFILNYEDDQQLYLAQLKIDDVTKAVDKQKTIRAVYVNAVHALDAYYMRSILEQITKRKSLIISVHDGFAIPPTQVSWLISSANMVFNKPQPPFAYSNSILI